MQVIHFIKQFVSNPTKTGAIAPSSEGLADLITDAADLSNTSAVIELGPGTGIFTEKILQKISGETRFFALEINPHFVEATRNRCPNAEIYHDSATNARKYLYRHDLKECDSIICGLPWASFSEGLQNELLDTIADILKPGGKFLTFAYLQGLLLPAGIRFKKILSTRFRHLTKTKTVWMNFPPAFVYCAEK
ncbi:MAG: methyltransferase domain-containing protein [Planctomycetes bacterium]|nr:methyltransferase domain-containing protein [Planctomycetota bacterium]